jgi:hypothetical protein
MTNRCAGATRGRIAVRQPDHPTKVRAEEITIEAAYLATHLGLTVKELRAGMRRGIVYGVAERGIGANLGRSRLTFHYRARSWSVMIERDGTFRDTDPKP